MKNKSLLIASVFAVTASTVSAQDLTSKKGEPFLPEAGDWAISFDAAPFLNYFGQMLSNAGAVSPTAGYTNGMPWSIRGKMFTDATTAYRGGLRLGFGSRKWTNDIATLQASTTVPSDYPAEQPMSTDEYKRSATNIVLSGGLEMRKGKTRLQGYYGGELIIGFGSVKDAYTYGQALSTGLTPDPQVEVVTSGAGTSTTDWSTMGVAGNIVADPLSQMGRDARVTERKTSNMTIGLRGFIGVEYFLFPKISIGAEYGWGFGMTSNKTTTTTEGNEPAATTGALAVGTFTKEVKTSGWAIDSDIQNNATGALGGSGSLNIIFHF